MIKSAHLIRAYEFIVPNYLNFIFIGYSVVSLSHSGVSMGHFGLIKGMFGLLRDTFGLHRGIFGFLSQGYVWVT